MNRDQMVEQARDEISAWDNECGCPIPGDLAESIGKSVLDAILPQVTTVADLHALPHNAVVMAPRSGVCMRQWEAVENGWPGSPALTVVWQPETEQKA